MNNLWGSTTAGITAGHENTKEAFGEIEIPLLQERSRAPRTSRSTARRGSPALEAVRAATAMTEIEQRQLDLQGGRQLVADELAAPARDLRHVVPLTRRCSRNSWRTSPASSARASTPASAMANRTTQKSRRTAPRRAFPADYTGAGPRSRSSRAAASAISKPETSKALTLSAIFTPDGWLWSGGQFSFAVDYVNINVKSQITQLGGDEHPHRLLHVGQLPDRSALLAVHSCAGHGARTSSRSRRFRTRTSTSTQQLSKSVDFTLRYRQDLGNAGAACRCSDR